MLHDVFPSIRELPSVYVDSLLWGVSLILDGEFKSTIATFSYSQLFQDQ
jgi:hypothetical protein